MAKTSSRGRIAEGYGYSGAPVVVHRKGRWRGADCCGEIVATGAGVPEERLGGRVLVPALQSTDRGEIAPAIETFGSERDGAFAEYTPCRWRDAIAVDSGFSDVELASFPCPFSTAEGMIQRVWPQIVHGSMEAAHVARLRGEVIGMFLSRYADVDADGS